MDYPDAKGWITKSRRPLTRQELDAQESGDLGVSRSEDPYVQLAEMFNDPLLPVKNAACLYAAGKKLDVVAQPYYYYNGSPVPLSFSDIFERVRSIDPSQFTNRDGDWIKAKMKDIRDVLTTFCGPDKKTGFCGPDKN